MISKASIQQFVDRVVAEFRPHKVILFGSYAYGSPREDSDVDLMVVMPYEGSSAQAATRVRLACPREFPMDLMVRSPKEVRQRIRLGDGFMKEVTSKGIVLHEAGNERVGG
jgi:uncharacterized protein